MKIQKILIIALTLVPFSNLNASKEQSCFTSGGTAAAVVTDSPSYCFEAYISALWLKPTSNNLNFAVEAIPLPAPTPNWNVFCLKPKYHAAFDLGFKIIMHENDTALMANWERFRSSTCAGINVGTDNMVGPLFEIGPDAETYKQTCGRVHFSFDEVNLDFGKLVRYGDDLQSNLFGGIGFVKIKQCLFSQYASDDLSTVRGITTPSSFIGAGPQVGIESSYCLCGNFNLTGKAITSLLVGQLKNHTQYSALSPFLAGLDITPPNIQNTCVCKSFGIVPAFEEKLGVSYSTSFCDDDYTLQVAAGYQVQFYLGAIQSVDMSSEVVTPPVIPDTVGVFARTFHKNTSNFALAGPYLTFDFAF